MKTYNFFFFLFWIMLLVSLCYDRSQRFYPKFKKSFLALQFIFNSAIHFELIFIEEVRLRSRFFFFFFSYMNVPFFSIIFKTSSIELLLHIYQKLLGMFVWIYFWVLYPVPCFFLSLAILHNLHGCNNTLKLGILILPVYFTLSKWFLLF